MGSATTTQTSGKSTFRPGAGASGSGGTRPGAGATGSTGKPGNNHSNGVKKNSTGPTKGSKSDTGKFDGNYFYCQKAGHRQVECRSKARDEKNGTIKNNSDVGSAGVDSTGDNAWSVLVAHDMRVRTQHKEVTGIATFVDSVASRPFISEDLARELGATFKSIDEQSATLNGVVREEIAIDQDLELCLGPKNKEISISLKDARVRKSLPWGLKLLVPFSVFNKAFDVAHWESADKHVTRFTKGDITIECKWVGSINPESILAATLDGSSQFADVSTIIGKKVEEISTAIAEQDLRIGEELATKQDEADRDSDADARVEMGTLVKDAFAKANVIVDIKERLLAYAETLRNWKDSSTSDPGYQSQVKEYGKLIMAHFDRDMGPDAPMIPRRMNTTVPYTHNIDETKRPIIVKRPNCGMLGSPIYNASEAMIAKFVEAGLLGKSLALDRMDPRISILGWKPVLKNGAKDFTVETIRLTVGGHQITNIMDWGQVPPVSRRKAALQVLSTALYDPDGEPTIMSEADLKNGYLQGNRMNPKDARVAMLNPDGKSARLLLGPIYGYPNAGIHFDAALCQSLPPQVTDKGYVDDLVDGKHTVLSFLKGHNETLRALLENNNTISMKKYWLRQYMSKFGAFVSPDGIAIDTRPLQDLLDIKTPNSLEDFKSQSHKVLYFGQFIPFVAAAISKISNYWHGKSEMPSKEQRVEDWSRVMDLVRKHVTINHFDPSLQTFVGLDWSETGEFYIVFQVLEKPNGDASVHVVSHSQKLHKTKYEQTAPAFTGELANLTRAARDLEFDLGRCISKPVILMDCEPIVKASLTDFRSLFTIGNKKHQRDLMEFLHVYPSINATFVHLKRERNAICDFYSYLDVIMPAYRFIQSRSGEASDGATLFSALETPSGEETRKTQTQEIAAAGVKTESQVKGYKDRLALLENAADKNPTDEYAPLLRLIKDGKALNLDDLVHTLHKDDFDSISQLVGKPDLIEFKGDGDSKIYVRGELYVPPRARYDTIRKAHSIPEAGHFAFGTTMYNLQGLHMPGKREDVEAYINLCGPSALYAGIGIASVFISVFTTWTKTGK